jgi:hypothetical protein
MGLSLGGRRAMNGIAEPNKSLWRLVSLVALVGIIAALFAAQPWRNAILVQQHSLGQLQGGKWLKRLAERSSGINTTPAQAAPDVSADLPSGFYPAPVQISLASRAAEGTIRYTLDGSTPNEASAIYQEPITIKQTAVLRFRNISGAAAPGPIQLRSLVIGGDYRLPIFSLVLDPVHLWNRHSGIYVNYDNRGAKWQRPATVEYLEYLDSRQVRSLQFPATVGLQGNWTRKSRKKSFQLAYATTALHAADTGGLLKPENAGPKRAVVLRAAGINTNYRLGHELFRSVYGAAGGLVPRSTAVMLLLNGNPWGVYQLQGKIDKHYLRERFGAGDYEIVELTDDDGQTNPGSWKRLLNFIAARDLADDSEFAEVAKRIDLDNFTDYWLFNVYAGNMDWPHNNQLVFRKADGSQPWRWLSWDSDAAFQAEAVGHRTLEWSLRDRRRNDLAYGADGAPTDGESDFTGTQIMRSLLRNRAYRERFQLRFKQLLASDLAPTQLRGRFDRLIADLVPHLGVDWALWPRSQQNFVDGVDSVRRFIDNRPRYLEREFQAYFGRAD